MRRVTGAFVLAGGLGLAGGCLRATTYQCDLDAQCGADGVCEPGGSCSFPAADCPGGRRYGEATGPLAGQCVGDGPDAGELVTDASIAEPDDGVAPPPPPFGDLRDGNLTTGNSDLRINTYGVITTPAAAGATTVSIAIRMNPNAGTWVHDVTVGDQVMLFQPAGALDPPTSGSPAPLVLSSQPGRYHVSRVVARGATTMTIADPLPVAFAPEVSQVVKLPQLRRVTVTGSGRLRAATWDNAHVGGVVGLFADELVLDGGSVDADGRGFRGGPRAEQVDRTGCAALDGTVATDGGARKGESLVAVRFGPGNPGSGRGNIYSGGGGGNCHNAGGGGGGSAAAGGLGGNDRDNQLVGGLGGAPVHVDPRTHLTFGGGGGAGEDDTGAGSAGGDGGGIVWIQVRAITCTNGGSIGADADSAGDAGIDGAGGGGGGGMVWIRAESITGCALTANGGDGGDALDSFGRGGGGGGGRIILATGSATGVTIDIAGGRPGSAGGSSRGATAGAPGASCGNGVREANETCDDGRLGLDDACATCSE